MIDIFRVLERLEENPSKNFKQELIKETGLYDPAGEFKELLRCVYNPYMTFGLQQLDDPATYNDVQPQVLPELFDILGILHRREATPTQGRAMVKNLMAKCTERNANWIKRIVRKDLKCGFSASTINKAYPGWIPQHKIQKGYPLVAKKPDAKGNIKDYRESLVWPIAGSEKFDGLRTTVVCDGESVKYMTSGGFEYELSCFDSQILSLRPGTKFVQEFEGIGIKLYEAPRNPATGKYDKKYKMTKAQEAHAKGMPWQFSQAQSMIKAADKYTSAEMKEYNGLITWDIIPYDWFISNGKVGTCPPYRQRRTEVAGLFEGRDFPNLRLAECWIFHNMEEVQAKFKEMRDKVGTEKGEGLMLYRLDRPYEFSRTDAILKMKEFSTCDLRIDEVQMGGVDTKWEGHIGTVYVTDGTVRGKLMSLGTEDDRDDLILRHLRGELIGLIVECDYMDVTADNSLRHAGFIRVRDDKTETSWN